MIFKKLFKDIDYDDICKLKNDKIEESEILDYKKEFQENKHENNLLREVDAFSNTSGGFLIYGVEESGEGGYPIAIDGIDDCNKERLEQIIISCIIPRIGVQIKKIKIPEKDKVILVIHIPEGQNQPYYNNRLQKFFKRYNFEAKEMDEHEIEALYLKRFFGVGRLSKYVDNTIFSNRSQLSTDKSFLMDGHIIVTPLRVDDRILHNSKMGEIVRVEQNLKFEQVKNSYFLGYPKPSHYGIRWKSSGDDNVEIHRNGLIHCMLDFGYGREKSSGYVKELITYTIAERLLQTIQFSGFVYSKLDFTGKVKLILKVMNTRGSAIPIDSPKFSMFRYSDKCDTDEIYIEREWNSWELNNDYAVIAKNMIDELCNFYGVWEDSWLFRKIDDKIIFSS